MEKEKLYRLIKHKVYFKYFTLIVILLLYAPLFGIILTQFKFKEYSLRCFIAFAIHVIAVIILNVIYEKQFTLPDIDSVDMLYKYLCYFTLNHKYLEFTEAVTWFYNKIQTGYIERKDEDTNKNKVINNLHMVLRPRENHTTSYALEHMDGFKMLATEIISQYDSSNELKGLTSEEMENFRSEKPEKHFIINWVHDKNILIYLLVFPIHILGCFLLASLENSDFSLRAFWGNMCLYIPADLIAILLYNGIMKNNKCI